MYRISDIARVTQGLSAATSRSGVLLERERFQLVESSNLRDSCWVDMAGTRPIELARSVRIQDHLLHPHDVLVTARAGNVQAAMVPPGGAMTVANVTLLVVRPNEPGLGMGHYLWYWLTSSWGQAQLKRRLTTTATVTALSATNLGEVELPIPSPQELDRIARLVEVSEEAYAASVEAARLRKDVLRDSIIGTVNPRFKLDL